MLSYKSILLGDACIYCLAFTLTETEGNENFTLMITILKLPFECATAQVTLKGIGIITINQKLKAF
jgi:hypothetical protein